MTKSAKKKPRHLGKMKAVKIEFGEAQALQEKLEAAQRKLEEVRAQHRKTVLQPAVGTPAELRAKVDVDKFERALVAVDAIGVGVLKVLLDAYKATVRELEELQDADHQLGAAAADPS